MSLILTAEQHADLRDQLITLIECVESLRDRTNADHDSETAQAAAMAAVSALDLLDRAEANLAALVQDAAAMEWASRVDGRVKH